jgi:hypothetical protein
MIAESVEPVGGEVPGDDGREVGDRPLSVSSSGRQVKMVGSGRVVFGEAPPGVVCTKRPAVYVVISGRDGVRPTHVEDGSSGCPEVGVIRVRPRK